MIIFSYILLVIIVLILIRDNFTDITPMTVLCYPLIFSSFIAIILSSLDSNWIDISENFFPLWIVSIFFFFLGGKFSDLLVTNTFTHNTSSVNSVHFSYLRDILLIIISIIFFIRAINLISLNAYEFYVSTDYFSRELVAGYYEFLRSLLIILTIFSIASKKKNLLNIISIITGLLIFFMFQIKGMIVMTIFSGIILGKFYKKYKFYSAKFIIPSFFLLILVFTVSNSRFVNSLDNYQKIDLKIVDSFAKSSTYLVSGVFGFSSFENQNKKSLPVLLSPFNNLLREKLNLKRAVIESNPRLIYGSNITSNVSTLVGTIYNYSNFTYTIIFLFVIGFFSKVLFNLRNVNIFFDAAYSINLSSLLYAFFEYYYWHQYLITIICFLVLIGIIIKFLRL
tara:strand:+ start:465 stop:1649 length:1185 start_codon:yes stop_codon:yes gene_type:complete